MAANIGVMRRLASIKYKNNSAGPDGRVWDFDIEGACAELAYAKAMGKFWDGSINTFKDPDVGDVQVRSTRYNNGCLILRKTDSPDDWYVLLTGWCGEYIIRGHIKGGHGMLPEYWKTHEGEPHRDAYFVPQSKLT
jgi:hypothetical protein